MPDGRTFSVVTTPNPEGGVTYLFNDVTESLELARRFDRLIQVQRETLDNLAEAVAVFGSNGRARLFNPAFARIGSFRPRRCRNSRISKPSKHGAGRCSTTPVPGERFAR